jgi:hypothetical protein
MKKLEGRGKGKREDMAGGKKEGCGRKNGRWK